MKDPDNPLVSFNTYETISRIRSVVTFLQSYYCLNDIHEKRPPKDVDEEVYTGLFYILLTMDQALTFEMTRIEEEKQAAQQSKASS